MTALDPKTITDLGKASGCAEHILSESVKLLHVVKTVANNGGPKAAWQITAKSDGNTD